MNSLLWHARRGLTLSLFTWALIQNSSMACRRVVRALQSTLSNHCYSETVTRRSKVTHLLPSQSVGHLEMILDHLRWDSEHSSLSFRLLRSCSCVVEHTTNLARLRLRLTGNQMWLVYTPKPFFLQYINWPLGEIGALPYCHFDIYFLENICGLNWVFFAHLMIRKHAVWRQDRITSVRDSCPGRLHGNSLLTCAPAFKVNTWVEKGVT